MILESVVIVAFALLLDFLVGDPKTKYHPTAWIGKLIASLVPFTKSTKGKKLKKKAKTHKALLMENKTLFFDLI